MDRPQTSLVERICILLLLLVAGFVLLNSPVFAISEVTVAGNEAVAAKEIICTAKIPLGDNIFRVSLKDAAARVEAIPAIKEARLRRHLPGRVAIQVTERKAAALVSGADGLYGLDDTGVCIGKFRASAPLPVVTGAGKAPNPGQRLSTKGFATAVAVLTALDESLISQLSEIHVTPHQTVEAYTADGIKLYFGRPERVAEKGAAVQRILGALGDRRVEYIDLKVANRPVVRFAEAEAEDIADGPLDGAGGGPLFRTDDRGSVSSLP
ncbi:MAG TPA: FtsQ-type POTRA domain-containing protein [Desulfotomaculum sp.]|nr:FtsQ-type POTRA domain-containing protein [Desulfotomaculum sp.]